MMDERARERDMAGGEAIAADSTSDTAGGESMAADGTSDTAEAGGKSALPLSSRLRTPDRLHAGSTNHTGEAAAPAAPGAIRPDASSEWRELFLAVRRAVERLRE